jgi:hypothetical protein
MVTGEEDLSAVEELLAVKLDPASGGKALRRDGRSLS